MLFFCQHVFSIFGLGLITSDNDRKVKDDGYTKYAFNVLISNRIGDYRPIPDTRNPLCKTQSYLPTSDLQKVSIIICFFNEALSVLTRTVTSILKRTQLDLIEEILLIDDFSDYGKLVKQQIDYLNLFCSFLKILKTKSKKLFKSIWTRLKLK